jgi:hypothetical protein
MDLREAGLATTTITVYQALGGIAKEPRISPGTWDLQVDGVAVELDEERHFNRYRAVTLEADIYQSLRLPHADYIGFCAEYETACLRAAAWRGNWTTPASEREFGTAGPEGDLTGRGSPRWRQRAFYDFIKDLAPLCGDIQVARVAIWELIEVDGERKQLGDVLKHSGPPDRQRAWAEALGLLVLARAGVGHA